MLLRAVSLLILCLSAVSPDEPVAQAQTSTPAALKPAVEPPQPGPELLTFTPEQIEQAYSGKKLPEAVEMYLVIARGGQLDGTNGWFHPAASRYSWEWLAERLGGDSNQPLKRESFRGSERIFDQLDRDHDGKLSGFDLDWSDSNSWVRQSYMVNRMFRRFDADGDGLLTAAEWQTWFARVSDGGEPVRFEQMRNALIPPSSGFSPGDMPSKEILIKGFLAGEIGSLQEGPAINDPAPDFMVKAIDGDETVRLSDRIGRRPLVLVFGNFTCGPFRSLYPTVEAVWNRQKDNADFLFVYVREAHPTDGWAMKSNEKAGVAVAQPQTWDERRQVAGQCAALLKPNIPFYVDDVTDTAGNAWSAMPARLYVLDSSGRVAYKSGRGPFGFKPEEMEQALLMLQLEEADVN